MVHSHCRIHRYQVSAFPHQIVGRRSKPHSLLEGRLHHSNRQQGRYCCCYCFRIDCKWEVSGIADLGCTEEEDRHLEACGSSLYRKMVDDRPCDDGVV